MVENNGVIRIGESYQAMVPGSNASLADITRKDVSPPRKIWSNNLTDEEMDEFFIRANKIINETKYRKLLEYQRLLNNSSNSGETEARLIVDGSWVAVNCDVKDLLHELLHECKFDKQKTLIDVGGSILPHLSVWSLDEQKIFNSQYEYDIELLKAVLPGKTKVEIENYHLRYINSAAELESNLLLSEPETARAYLQRMRSDRTPQPAKVMPKLTTSSASFLQRLSNTFDPYSCQQVVNCLVFYNTGFCSPAELVVRVRCVLENSVVNSVNSSKRAETYPSKVDALNDFFIFLPEAVRNKLLLI